MKKPTPSADRLAVAVERAEMPAILFPADLVRHFPILVDERHADRAVRQGLFGPWFIVEDQPALQRDDLKEHLRRRARRHDQRPGPGPRPIRGEGE